MRMYLLLFLSILSLGCGSSNGVQLGTVVGTVHYLDEPIPDGKIIFEVPGSRPAVGQIVHGEIVDVTTYEVGDGVPVGEAKIAIFGFDPKNDGDQGYMDMNRKSIIPTHYNNPSTSELVCTIKPEQNELEFELTK
ncbi:hypothetical protein AB1K70_07260 [Bremerella sp. JC770]|uniref:hypothetical protein n=1 Tax=Bremerella sp. JC770 TaxID=3232137 RepID=UPI003458FA14